MKILFLYNNLVVINLLGWLQRQEDVIDYTNVVDTEHIIEIKPELVISYCYKHIIKKKVLDLLPYKVLNLHTSYLPWNRGYDPNIWSFLEDTPKGVTIHLIDEGIDTGDILLQQQCNFNKSKETFRTSYYKLHNCIQNLFISNWKYLKSLNYIRFPQPTNIGSFHFKKDLKFRPNLDIPIIEAIEQC